MPIPSDLSGLSLWIKADDIGTFADNDPIATALDRSGNGRNFTAAGAVRPTYKTGIINGLPVMRFDGSDDLMTESAALSALTTSSQYTMLWLVSITGTASTHATSYENDGLICDNGAFMATTIKDVTGTPNVLVYNWDGTEDVAQAALAGYNTASIITVDHDNVNIRVSVDQGSFTSVASGATTNISNAVFMGRGWSNLNYVQADIGEMIMFNRMLTGPETTDMWDYLEAKWLTAAGAAAAGPGRTFNPIPFMGGR